MHFREICRLWRVSSNLLDLRKIQGFVYDTHQHIITGPATVLPSPSLNGRLLFCCLPPANNKVLEWGLWARASANEQKRGAVGQQALGTQGHLSACYLQTMEISCSKPFIVQTEQRLGYLQQHRLPWTVLNGQRQYWFAVLQF